jgi:hypothetical protein
VIQLLVTANVVPSSLILVTLMMERIRFSEMSVLTRATWPLVDDWTQAQVLYDMKVTVSLRLASEFQAHGTVQPLSLYTFMAWCLGMGTALPFIWTNPYIHVQKLHVFPVLEECGNDHCLMWSGAIEMSLISIGSINS